MPSLDLMLDDLEEIVIPFEHKGESYELREATGGAIKDFNNARTSRIKLGPGGKPSGMGNLGDLQPLLVSLCCFDSQNKHVPIKVIEKWGGRMVERLFEKAKEISGLDNEDTTGEEISKALSDPSSPVSLETLRSFVLELDEKEFPQLHRLFRASSEEKVGNSQGD